MRQFYNVYKPFVHGDRTINSSPARRCRRKFLRYFSAAFRDETYLEWERNYKAEAHEAWEQALHQSEFRAMLRRGEFMEIAAAAVRIESRTNLLFSFEKMALRDAVRSAGGAKIFAEALYDFLYGAGNLEKRFGRWRDAVGELPRRQTRVLTWPVLTVFPFIALPKEHIFLKPNVTRRAADAYGFEFLYQSKPGWETYESLLDFAGVVRKDLRDLKPRDMIDIQSFSWVQGSDEYPD
ncbi:MAG TPA: hypothetical protein VGG19_00415 [Tepidisphaeraceae bacterium]